MMNKYSRQPGDDMLALLERGEYVLNRNAVKEIGKENLDELNYVDAPRFDMSQRGEMMMSQTGGMLGDMIGYQGGGEAKKKKRPTTPKESIEMWFEDEYPELMAKTKQYGEPLEHGYKSDIDFEKVNIDKRAAEKTLGGRFHQVLSIPASEVGEGEGLRYYLGEGGQMRGLPNPQWQQGMAIYNALQKMQDAPQDSIPKSLLGYQLGGILGMQAGGSTLNYGGATSETQSLEDMYQRMGIQPTPEQEEKFRKQYAYDPSREGVIFEDYGRAITGATQTGQQNLMGAGQKMQETQAKSGFAGGGAGAQSMSQQRGNIMQDFLAQEGAAKSALFKGVRGEREKWMTDVSSGLGRLQSEGGTEDYINLNTPIGGAPVVTVLPTVNQGSVTYNGSRYTWSEEEGAYVQG